MRRSLFLPLFLRCVGTAFIAAAAVWLLLQAGVLGAVGIVLVGVGLCAWLASSAARLVESTASVLQAEVAGTRNGLVMQRTVPREYESLAEAIEQRLQREASAAAALLEGRRQLEVLLDSMRDAVLAVDESGRVLWANEPMRRQAAAPGAIRLGHHLVQSIREPEVLACVRAALEEGTAAERDAVRFSTGRMYTISAEPMPAGAVLVLRDVTRMERLEQTQREFVANVSHELRTPLTSVAGYVAILLDDLSEGTAVPVSAARTARHREFLEAIAKNAGRMERLTEDLLALARVESDEQPMQLERVGAQELLDEAAEAVAGYLQAGAWLDRVPAPDVTVQADRQAVVQVLSNLIENAVNYAVGAAGGRIVLGAAASSTQEGMLVFSVADSGPGIAMEHRERIFERFYRADKTRSRETGGTGLGLSIARHLVEEQGGTLWVESELGQGSKFCFSLPLNEPGGRATEDESARLKEPAE